MLKLDHSVQITDGKGDRVTVTVFDAIVAQVEVGVPIRHAAKAAGVGERTVHDWRSAGREVQGVDRDTLTPKQQRLADFAAALERAEGAAVSVNVQIVREAARTKWQAAAWWLERRYPAEFGREIRVVDDSPHDPAEFDGDRVGTYASAYSEIYGEELPEIDDANRMPGLPSRARSEPEK